MWEFEELMILPGTEQERDWLAERLSTLSKKEKHIVSAIVISARPESMAEAINQQLAKVGFRDLGVKERPGLVILRRSTSPALLVETGFINTDADNQLFDEQFHEIAQAIADGILEVVREDSTETDSGTRPEGTLYRVQTGAFRNQQYAQDMLYQLTGQGYPAFILQDGNLYRVQVGAFRNLDNAIKMEAALRSRGYSTYITT